LYIAGFLLDYLSISLCTYLLNIHLFLDVLSILASFRCLFDCFLVDLLLNLFLQFLCLDVVLMNLLTLGNFLLDLDSIFLDILEHVAALLLLADCGYASNTLVLTCSLH